LQELIAQMLLLITGLVAVWFGIKTDSVLLGSLPFILYTLIRLFRVPLNRAPRPILDEDKKLLYEYLLTHQPTNYQLAVTIVPHYDPMFAKAIKSVFQECQWNVYVDPSIENVPEKGIWLQGHGGPLKPLIRDALGHALGVKVEMDDLHSRKGPFTLSFGR
jgi:hypothetical protein